MARYMLTVAGKDWRRTYLLVNRLLRRGVPVYWTMGGAQTGVAGAALPNGSFVLGGAGGAGDGSLIRELAGALDITLEQRPVDGFETLLRLRSARVAVYGGGGAPFHHLFALRSLGFDAEPIMPEQIRAGALAAFDALAMPGGGWQAMAGELAPLGAEGCRAIAAFVRAGGMYLGSCAGAYIAAVTPSSFCQACPEQRDLQLINAAIWNSGDPAWGGLQSPGIGVLEAAVVDRAHPITFNLPDSFEIVHYNGPLFAPVSGVIPGASGAHGLLRVRQATARFTPGEAFLGPPTEDALLIDRATEATCFNAIAGALGMGQVVLFGSHPEFGGDLSLTGIADAALLLANAVLWHGSMTSPIAASPAATGWPALWSDPPSACLAAPRRRLPELARLVSEVARVQEARTLPWWLDRRYSLSMFGRGPEEIWSVELARMRSLLDELAGSLDEIGRLLDRLTIHGDRPMATAVLTRAVREICYRRDPAWGADGGFNGLDAVLSEVGTLLAAARERTAAPAPPVPADAYDGAERNPYHLAVGSYLAASGLLTGAALWARSIVADLEGALAQDSAT